MNWQTAKEVITVVLSIIGAVGLIVTPIVVAIISNRPKLKELQSKNNQTQTQPAVSMGMPVNLEYQMQTNTLMKYLDDVIDSKNELEKRLFDAETRERIQREQIEALMKSREKDKDSNP
jgi:hypothetical protein